MTDEMKLRKRANDTVAEFIRHDNWLDKIWLHLNNQKYTLSYIKLHQKSRTKSLLYALCHNIQLTFFKTSI